VVADPMHPHYNGRSLVHEPPAWWTATRSPNSGTVFVDSTEHIDPQRDAVPRNAIVTQRQDTSISGFIVQIDNTS
jgi:hypothetical protein